ncbi:MAG: CHASE2 domain-containing protein [Betaproteobacteria bacterium]|nr:MAG: CHASE2 domain-containing protein [Betaproteobacteria bacterium]
MTKAGFWKTDWFLGVAVVVCVALFARASDLVPSLERKAYDLGVIATSRTPLDKIAVIAIDEQSLANLGRWPWSREVLAKLTDSLAAAKAKVIAYTVLFSEPQTDPGYTYVTKLLDLTGAGAPAAVVPADAAQAPIAPVTAPAAAPVTGELAQFIALLKEAEQKLNTDRRLSESFAHAGNVVPMTLFDLGAALGKPDKPLPEFVARNSLPKAVKVTDDSILPTRKIDYPIEILGKASAALGYLNSTPDVDGGTRAESLVLDYFGQIYPSLSMMVAARSLNLGVGDIKVQPGEKVSLGRLNIVTDPFTRMYAYFYKDRDGRPAFPVDSFYDVISGKIPVSKYQDKIVLIGPTAPGLGSAAITPVSPAMPPVLVLAHSVSSILSEHFFVAPIWGYWVELLVFVLIAAYLIGILPRLKAGMGAMITAALIGLLLITHFVLMTTSAMWLQLMLPLVLLVIGHVLLVTKRFVLTEAGKVKSDADSAESNRMLGLAFQGQGQLDMAWDKFRKVPLDDGVMDNLYNLALDFERKRQFNKAENVFQYMANHNPKFRDLESRLNRARAMSETIVLGGASSHPGGSMSLGAGAEKPMLGRYQVEKELGKGAMGVVYQGKDPKIGRVVAIKTMALSQEFEAEELVEVKERFFREAETAGRLSHPNIVTIYDAGEEHDLCYIAMELLKGKDLIPFTKPDNLLPMDKVVSIIARVADALGYAHKQNIVHRDIKPANIMYEPESDAPKVTDFGIARITDSSKTKTGMVLGTPSYMSPEQLSGKKVDGRSDLFSLAVSLYQMLCGALPFVGDSMAQLMFKIANEPAAEIFLVRPGIPPALVAFLDKAMAKEAEDRYQTGEEFAAALRAAFAAGAAPVGGVGTDAGA